VDPGRVDVILVRPQRAANVAAACRALKNMGLRSLILVDPPAGLPDGPDRALAYGAWDVLDGARRHGSLREAVSECSVVAGTSGRLPSAWTPRRLAAEADALAAGGRLGLVFGPEATGLTNEELALCHLRVHIPADPLHPSLNLAQAVLVLAYEMRLSGATSEREQDEAEETAARPAGELESVLDHLRGGLLSIGYLNPLNPGLLVAELRALLWRARPTARELVLLHGLARQVGWAGAEIARLRSEPDNPGAKGAP
jgi:tRNA (cytidine32/uridine32-2'-O)-methyltransferase